MKNQKISLLQYFILIVIFQVGSTIVVGTGNNAKQDAWIAVILAGLAGMIIIAFYYWLLSMVPGKNLYEAVEAGIGKWVAKPVIMMYTVYFFYLSARVLRDFDELLVSSIFINTPVEIISITMILVIGYALYLGIEVLSRTSEVFMPYVVVFILFLAAGLFMSGEIKYTNVLPVLAEGLQPVLKVLFPSMITFPFGEVIAFTLLLPLINPQKKVLTASLLAVLTSTVIICLTTIIQLMTLGVDMKSRSNFPLLSAAREISLLDFIERVDLIIVFVMMFGIIVKVGIFFYGGLLGMQKLFGRSYKDFVFPIGLLIAFISVLISEDLAEHLMEGLEFVPIYLHIPFQFGFPAVLALLLFLKFKKKEKAYEEHKS
ncbi:endospore germination permease [Bacillus lacus]|uniref:Endospore germination permease n=1 Tax=Metabacillus lacus TaxID=1983721 RepID=A0A7X2J0I3_9BACI|nr:endospore germination permease [Metabacillus lacus]MRX72882.1 endospore germination permease [Metabacillus lacus]